MTKEKLPMAIYIALNVVVIVAGIYLFLDMFQVVGLGTVVSFWMCLILPFIAVGLYLLSVIQRKFFGLDRFEKGQQALRFPKIIFILSSVAMMWYANTSHRNVVGVWNTVWVATTFFGIIILIALTVIYPKCPDKLRVLCKSAAFVIFGGCFLLGAFLSANLVLDTSEPLVTAHRVVSARRNTGNGPGNFFVTIENSASCRMTLETSSTVFRHARDNLNEPIYMMSRNGAFHITYRRLALVGDGPGGIERLR